MEFAFTLILVGAALVLVSIFASLVFARIGAPLLLLFLGIGMLVGVDGPIGIEFDNFGLTYVVGSVALAIILFDGGLRTSRESLRLAAPPATTLATVGVILTAGIGGLIVAPILGLPLIEGALLGAIVGSTDAAAVFPLLNRRSNAIERRVGATLEVESGLNDPTAVFLTVLLVQVVEAREAFSTMDAFALFLTQMAGGGIIGLAGGAALLWAVNRASIATGLYPILVVTSGIFVFALAQTLDASGFLAIYVAGLVFGLGRHRARQHIARFHDGLAWLSQIVMFLLLGLLVTPSSLVPDLAPALAVALGLMLIARPVSVAICLLPFRFNWSEIVFIGWVGLRGAVPIFLATIPVVAGLQNATLFFNVAFVVVIASLVVQGWTIAPAARWLGLMVPPSPQSGDQVDLGAPMTGDRDLMSYRVGANSLAARRAFGQLGLPDRTRVLAVLRNNVALARNAIERLEAGDTLLLLTPPETSLALDRLFASRTTRAEDEVIGDFVFSAATPAATLSDLYGLPVAATDRELALGDLMRRRLGRKPVVGDRVEIGPAQLVVSELDGDRIAKIGLFLQRKRPPARGTVIRLRRLWRRIRRRFARRRLKSE
ncbi:MAG: potassium/proton antiporter [Reyranellaceae bacterium]